MALTDHYKLKVGEGVYVTTVMPRSSQDQVMRKGRSFHAVVAAVHRVGGPTSTNAFIILTDKKGRSYGWWKVMFRNADQPKKLRKGCKWTVSLDPNEPWWNEMPVLDHDMAL